MVLDNAFCFFFIFYAFSFYIFNIIFEQNIMEVKVEGGRGRERGEEEEEEKEEVGRIS